MQNNSLVIDYEQEGSDSAERLFVHIDNLTKDLAGSPLDIEVVLYGKAILIALNNSAHQDALSVLSNQGVKISVCQNAMNALDVQSESLTSSVQIVPSGIGQIIKAQLVGAAYYKAL